MYKKPNNSEYIIGLIISKETIDKIITNIRDELSTYNLDERYDNADFDYLKKYSNSYINKINEIISSNTDLSDDVIKYIITPYATFDKDNFYIDKLNTNYECNLIRNKLKFVNKLYFDRFKKYYVIGYKVNYEIIKENTDIINDYKIQFSNIWSKYFSNQIDLFQIPII